MASSVDVAMLSPFQPYPPFAGPIHLGPRGSLHVIHQFCGVPIFSIRKAFAIVRR